MRRLTLITLLFITSNSYSQWFQLPNLPLSGTVWDMQFVNASTGFISLISPVNFLKTTDGGMSWNTQSLNIRNFHFVNTFVGYGVGFSGTDGVVWKTTDGGINWFSVLTSGNGYADVYFPNKDTGWVCGTDFNFGKIWKTTNGGVNFNLVYTTPTGGHLDKLFFLKEKLNGEYVGWANTGHIFYRTLNSGNNWITLGNSPCTNGVDFYFKDTANGVSVGMSCFSLTTNGGYNWVAKSENTYQGSRITSPNNNTVWISLGNDKIIKTTNFFQTYGKQQLTSGTKLIFAVDTSIVYGVAMQNNVVKTTNGGGDIVVSVSNQSTIVNNYFLFQNYPNPFNPYTIINYQLAFNSFVLLKVYDIMGKKIQTLTDRQQAAGNYSVQFDGSNLPSGVYYYKLETENFTETRKMVLLK